MTSDTDDDNDTIKINIDRYSNHKLYFKNRLGALLSNPHFLLVYVPEDGAKMQVIRPANDSYHRRRMIRRINEADEAEGIPSFYYALSHLWGVSPDNRYHWNDISEYVDDEDGQPAKPVSMRPEKRDTLLALLKDHPDSYWWIDVLCARTDTPLDIMGDIYAYCLECIAMIDCEPDLISQLHQMEVFDFQHFSQCCSDDVVAARRSYDQCCQLTDSLCILIQSRWWKRVWTWQEMALPFGEVCLMAETGTHKPLSNTITMRELVRNYDKMSSFMGRVESLNSDIKRPEYGKTKEKMTRVDRKATLDAWSDEACAASVYNRDRLGDSYIEHNFLSLLWTLGNSPRRCMDPVDYVYGVLGIFHFKIPRMDDPDAVWKLFLSEMDKFLDSLETPFRISDRAYQVDLRKAQDMADVYRDLTNHNFLFHAVYRM
ncbi:predicted protein [Lichtheimia corymbifera JMRC:FSU:9682]|uniref:Heterokaryon incompatibility domain-containing protein n=1 Tax=Lichtheimia corymbifera JMRC:FSU:9682 TaxID=1263082 RepID=A0A068REF9_9FUNG|nr:predicted protein [Lichtheimia corymbifera JMRC:FSU:9682]